MPVGHPAKLAPSLVGAKRTAPPCEPLVVASVAMLLRSSRPHSYGPRPIPSRGCAPGMIVLSPVARREGSKRCRWRRRKLREDSVGRGRQERQPDAFLVQELWSPCTPGILQLPAPALFSLEVPSSVLLSGQFSPCFASLYLVWAAFGGSPVVQEAAAARGQPPDPRPTIVFSTIDHPIMRDWALPGVDVEVFPSGLVLEEMDSTAVSSSLE